MLRKVRQTLIEDGEDKGMYRLYYTFRAEGSTWVDIESDMTVGGLCTHPGMITGYVDLESRIYGAVEIDTYSQIHGSTIRCDSSSIFTLSKCNINFSTINAYTNCEMISVNSRLSNIGIAHNILKTYDHKSIVRTTAFASVNMYLMFDLVDNDYILAHHLGYAIIVGKEFTSIGCQLFDNKIFFEGEKTIRNEMESRSIFSRYSQNIPAFNALVGLVRYMVEKK